jgi:hypothetical protein
MSTDRHGMVSGGTIRPTEQVQAEHTQDISSRQSPLLIGISVGLIIVGLGLIFSNVDYFMGLFNQDAMGLALSAQRCD